MTNLLDKYLVITNIKYDLDIKVANKIKHIYKLWYNVDISKEQVNWDSMFLVDDDENIQLTWYIGCGETNSCRMPVKYFYLTDAEILEIKDEEECIKYRDKQKCLRRRRELEAEENKRREENEYKRYLELKQKFEIKKSTTKKFYEDVEDEKN